MLWLVTGGSGFIGTNLTERLCAQGEAVINVDRAAPSHAAHRPLWRELDIADRAGLQALVARERPDVIVHLAAKADFDPDYAAFQAVNVEGSRNVLDSALRHPAVRLICASTQYVNGPNMPFDDDLVFHPVNVYGRSKMEMEQLMRAPAYAGLDWTIIRPTNIWGPHHPRFPTEMWKFIKRGLYLQPGGAPIMRSYGYVGNVVSQIELLAQAPVEQVKHRVFYVGDPPVDSGLFLDAFAYAMRGVPLRRLPRPLLYGLALTGDMLNRAGLRIPLTTDRYFRMTTAHLTREEKIWDALNYKPKALDEAVRETLAWLKANHPDIYAK